MCCCLGMIVHIKMHPMHTIKGLLDLQNKDSKHAGLCYVNDIMCKCSCNVLIEQCYVLTE